MSHYQYPYLLALWRKHFYCNSDIHQLVASFVGTLQGLASQRKTQMKLLFPAVETTKNINLGRILEKLDQRHKRQGQMESFHINVEDCENENCVPTQFLQVQKKSIN